MLIAIEPVADTGRRTVPTVDCDTFVRNGCNVRSYNTVGPGCDTRSRPADGDSSRNLNSSSTRPAPVGLVEIAAAAAVDEKCSIVDAGSNSD